MTASFFRPSIDDIVKVIQARLSKPGFKVRFTWIPVLVISSDLVVAVHHFDGRLWGEPILEIRAAEDI